MTLGSNGTLSLDGKRVSLPLDDMRPFLMANISEPCVLDGANMKDIMNVFFHLQDFIQDYFLEEYHVVNALVSTMKPIQRIERVEFYKEMVVDGDHFVNIIPKVNIVVSEEGSDSLKEASVHLVERLHVNDFSGTFGETKLWTNFTLLEVMDCAFSELGHILTSSSEDSSRIWSL